ncbi:hypothetical protein CW304_29405 [Bacillus sp. UFRGS-B20]|nr:hypothetical protein CW304_29405 [Bacillus sp. UFRGS-B20]
MCCYVTILKLRFEFCYSVLIAFYSLSSSHRNLPPTSHFVYFGINYFFVVLLKRKFIRKIRRTPPVKTMSILIYI